MDSIQEKVKSVILLGLIFLAVFLSQWVLYANANPTLNNISDMAFESVSVEHYINPQSYLISFGGLSYTKVYDSNLQTLIWESLNPYLMKNTDQFESLEVVDQATYVEAFSTPSILVRMPVNLGMMDLVNIYSDESLITELVGITPYEFLVCANEPNSVYIYDKSENVYYKVANQNTMPDIKDLIGKIESTDYTEYRKISDRFSLDSTVTDRENKLNYELLPYEYDYIVPSLVVTSEVIPDSDRFDSAIKPFSNLVFGNRMDFVKRLKDINGSTILMYGYGDKAITVSQEGDVSYTQKFDPKLAKEISFKEGLSIAGGTIEAFGIKPSGVTLIDYETDDGEISTKTYRFAYRINRYFVNENTGDISVTIRGNQLTMIKKRVRFYESELPGDVSLMYSIDNCITSNFLEISIYYLQDNDIYDASLNSIQYYFPIRSAIETIDMQYYEKEGVMIPIWHVVISGRTYLFNAYSGEMIRNYR